jgi:hypothetical protein
MCVNTGVPRSLTHPGEAETLATRGEIVYEEPSLAAALQDMSDDALRQLLATKDTAKLSPIQRSVITAAKIANMKNRVFSLPALVVRERELAAHDDND